MKTLIFLLAFGIGTVCGEDGSSAPPPADSFQDGLLRHFVDRNKGEVWLDLPAPDKGGLCAEVLYVESLRAGLGSNPVGLDRGQLGQQVVLEIRRIGNRVLFEVPNLRYRASSENPAEKRAVRESFARSILWGGDSLGFPNSDRCAVNITSFLLRDAHGIARTLKSSDQGSFKLDLARSAVLGEECRGFPDNLEFESVLTYAGDAPGRHVRSTTPDPAAVTLRQHHSFIRLPDAGYRPRVFDPRCGAFSMGFADYSAAIDEPLETHWVNRHRLEPGEKLIYYVDPGAPEPVRSALIEGASWWSTAFAKAGFPDGFEVRLLPPDADPLDLRYNVIQWVHRSTRGWSYGGSIRDPRTGEILKGHVSLGSLRVRQDRLLFDGLIGVDQDTSALALQRIRQLAAHEVGHTLGLAHNFAASTYGDRASVMDYPAPWVRVGDDGELDLSQVYGRGVGVWDVQAIRYLYTNFESPQAERTGLAAILAENAQEGYTYLTDADARSSSAAHPLANLWDNGADPVAELESVMAVRAVAMARFGRQNLREGEPLARLHEVFVPLYLYHRYQVEAVSKSIGGHDYEYSIHGSESPPCRPLARDEQLRAVDALLATLTPSALRIPESVSELLVPRPPAHGSNSEMFGSRGAPVFDPLGAAETLATMVIDGLVEPARLLRMSNTRAQDRAALGPGELLSRIESHLFDKVLDEDPMVRALEVVLQRCYVRRLLQLDGAARTSFEVQSLIHWRLLERERSLSRRPSRTQGQEFLAHLIRSHLDGKPRPPAPRALPGTLPPGSPIGCACGAR